MCVLKCNVPKKECRHNIFTTYHHPLVFKILCDIKILDKMFLCYRKFYLLNKSETNILGMTNFN